MGMTENKKEEDVVIIGSGPAGLTAALYTSREGFGPIVIEGTTAGGQLLLTNIVENFPGFPDGIYGGELISMIRKQAERFGTRFVSGDVTGVDFSSRPFRIMVGDDTYAAKSVIIATGASAKWLEIETERKFIGKGVSSCATCDGPFFKGKTVVVVGGGDTAMEDSVFLTKFAKSVTIVHRRDQFRASKIMQERMESNGHIKVIWDSVVEEIIGKEKVSGVVINNLKTGKKTTLEADGIFVAIGDIPNTSFLKGKIKLDEKGYIAAKEEVVTEIDGVFAAGDVVDHIYKQAVTAAGSGAKAALRVRDYLNRQRE